MELARHGSGVRSAAAALASQIHPVFMLPPVAASAFGAILAGRLDFIPFIVHLIAAFSALYTAHIKDGYIDFYHRGEDPDHPLTKTGCQAALLAATIVFGLCLVILGVVVDIFAVLLTLPGWVIGYLHAPHLDVHPVGATAGYPLGIAFALFGGYYVQVTMLSSSVVAFAVIFFLILCGIKVIDDTTDYAYDRSIEKQTVAVVVGPDTARVVAYAIMAVGMAAVGILALSPVFPWGALFAPLVFGTVAWFAWRAGDDDQLATQLLIRGSYLFLAVLIAAVWLG